MRRAFKAELTYLIPIFTSLLFGVLCSLLLLTSSAETYMIIPFPEGGVGSLGNAVYFITLVGVGAFLLYALVMRKSPKLLTLIIAFALAITMFMLCHIYLSRMLSRFPILHIDTIISVLSLLTTITACFIVLRVQSRFCNLIILCLGGALGAFLAASIPTLSTIMILCFLIVYDVFAVYYGPVGKIALKGLDKLRGLSFSFRNVQMGLGDLVFYSMLSGHMLLRFNVISCVASIVGIMLGCFLSLRILEKKGIFPGLPLPITFGLTASFLAFSI